MDTAIKFESVGKSYGPHKALDNLDLVVEPGEIYGFIGPNGAGKSTAIRLMLGHIRSQSGRISVLGHDPRTDELAIKRKVGYVASEAFLYPDMRVQDLFRFVEDFHGVHDGAIQGRLVEALDIDLRKRFEELSFGNRKKVAIACALLHSPKLVILDEPTNGLDPLIRANLYELLGQMRDAGTTVFFSSHVLGEVQRVCSRIGLIKGGRLIHEASASQFTNLGYRRVRLRSSEVLAMEGLEGVAGFSRQGDFQEFIYAGPPDSLVRWLGKYPLHELSIEEPDLESVFLHSFKDNH